VRALPADAPAGARGRPRFDLVGLLLAAPGMAGVLLGLSNVSHDGGFGHSDVLLPLTQAFGQAFWWTTGFTGLAVLASFFLPGLAHRAARRPGPVEVGGGERCQRGRGSSAADPVFEPACVLPAESPPTCSNSIRLPRPMR
jgi:hypothetical protein